MIASTGPNSTSRKKPNTWQVETLGTIASLKSGFAYRSQDWVESGVPVIKIANVRDGRVSLEGCSHVTEEVAADTEAFRVLNGDLLMTLTGEIGAIGVYQGAIPARLNQRVARIDIDEKGKVLFEFLFHYLESPHVREHLWSKAQGMAQPNISPKEVLRVPISIPSIAEQQEIVGILEEQFSRLDAAAASIAAVRRKADQFRRSLLRAAFTGCLTQHGARRMTTDEMPSGWQVLPLSEVVDVLDHLRRPINSKERQTRHGVVPYFGATGQVGTIDDFLFDEELVLLGEDGVQFFDQSKPKAYEISGKAWVNNHAHVLRCRAGKIEQKLLVHFLNQFDYRGFANGTTRLKLTQAAMNRIPVLLPPATEQREIVRIVEEQFSRQEAILSAADAADRKVAALIRSLLHAAFTGEMTKEWRNRNYG